MKSLIKSLNFVLFLTVLVLSNCHLDPAECRKLNPVDCKRYSECKLRLAGQTKTAATCNPKILLNVTPNSWAIDTLHFGWVPVPPSEDIVEKDKIRCEQAKGRYLPAIIEAGIIQSYAKCISQKACPSESQNQPQNLCNEETCTYVPEETRPEIALCIDAKETRLDCAIITTKKTCESLVIGYDKDAKQICDFTSKLDRPECILKPSYKEIYDANIDRSCPSVNGTTQNGDREKCEELKGCAYRESNFFTNATCSKFICPERNTNFVNLNTREIDLMQRCQTAPQCDYVTPADVGTCQERITTL